MNGRGWLKVGAWAAATAVTLFAGTVVVSWLHVRSEVATVPPDSTPAPIALLRAPIPEGPEAALLERGRYLTVAGDCVSCHTRIGGQPFEGGLGLQTPFGVIYSANITGDRLGAWTGDEFWRLMSRGVGRGGRHIYPAMPYNYYTRMSRADSDAILAYLQSVPGSGYVQPANLLPIPLGFRPALIGWNLLLLEDKRFRPDPERSAAANRGAELVEGLGHCGACHTPMSIAGSPEQGRYLQGAVLNGWVAPDLTGNMHTGLGRWSAADIAEYLKTGRNMHSNAAGPMAEVVSYSTSQMSDDDLLAIATYLKSLPAGPDTTAYAPGPQAMARGGAIYADSCTACHRADGRGQPGLFPPLPGSAVAQQADPAGIVRIILGGARTGPTPTRPSALTMPSFAWKLTDEEVADVTNYVRNSWDNRAPPVSARAVGKARDAGAFVKPASLSQQASP